MGNNRCKRCIMPIEYPGITFNSEGVCNYCTHSNSNTEENKTDLLGKDKLIELMRSTEKTGEVDCVVPLSGGKDSVYVLYYSVRELGLRPIAVTYSSGFQTQIAMQNVRNACDALNVPCFVEEANKNIQNRLLRESLRISETIGSFVKTCLNCSTIIKAIPIKVARQRRIPFVLWGDSVRESVRLMKMKSKLPTVKYEDVRSNSLVTGVAETMSRLRAVRMTPLKFIRIIPTLARYRFLTTHQLLSLGVPFKHVIFPNIGFAFPKKDPQVVHFFDYVDWDPVKGIAVLERELGWKHPPNTISRFDCSLSCFTSHRGLQVDGISGDAVISCNLIREGFLSREEAIEAEQLREHAVVEECERLISELGLDDFVIPALRNGRHSHDG